MKNIKYSKSIKNFCNKNNIDLKSLKQLKNDASRRRYYRFTDNKKNYLLMDSSLEKDSLENFIKISKWLKSNSFSSPQIYIKDRKLGLLIIEDFGNNKFSILCKNQKKKRVLL